MLEPSHERGVIWGALRTRDELSIVIPSDRVPEPLTGAKVETGWACLHVKGPLVFELVGIMSSITVPLAKAGISIFALSTYDTDYILVKKDQLE